MSGAVGSGYGSEQPQCYNCGAPGHWAIACPEPTRQTPAGLAAWRSSSHTYVGGSGGNRDRRSAPKKHKGPIITKYGPPPGQQHSQPQPPPPASAGNSFAPPGYHGHPPYHGSGPPLPSPQPPPPSGYSHYPPPPPGYPPAQPPPDYASRHYGHAPPHYPPTPPGPPQGPPPPPYAYDTHHTYRYAAQPSLPPPPPPQYHPPASNYHGYAEPDHGRRRHPSSPPPPPPHTHTYGSPALSSQGPHRGPRGFSPRSFSPPGPAPRQRHQGQRRNERGQTQRRHSPPPKKSTGQHSRRTSQTAAPISLPTPLIHSLPPKPPQTKQSQPEAQGQRGKNNKRKQDRQNRQKVNKQRQGNPAKDRGDQTQVDAPEAEHESRPLSSRGTPSPETHAKTGKTDASDGLVILPTEAIATDLVSLPQEPGSRVPPESTAAGGVESSPDSDNEEDEWAWAFKEIFKAPESTHEPDEIGSPLPFSYHDEILLPRKWDAHCIASKFVTPENLEQYMRPIHETEYWPHIEFDPAFVIKGKFPCGESIPKHLLTGEAPPQAREKATVPTQSALVHARKRSLSGSVDEDRRATKRHQASEARRVDSYVPSRSRSNDRRRSRSRSRQMPGESRSPPRPRSRRSSASSLNSLEAELLGISETHESPADSASPPRRPSSSGRRDESSRSPQMQRRRQRTDSAYSRRW